MKLRATQEEETAEVQMAPLIDCVFILLIFFLVTSMLQKPHQELAFEVPHSGAGEATGEQEEPILIVVTSENPDPLAPKRGASDPPLREPYIVMGDEQVTRELLERRLRQVAQRNAARRICIDSSGHLAWRHIVPILDLCRFHGLDRVEIRADSVYRPYETFR